MNEALATLIALERELHEPAVRGNRARLEALLHPDFQEIGRSGTRWSRADILERLPKEAVPITTHSQDFTAQSLAAGLVLLLYKSAHTTPDGGLQRHSLRSSIWCLCPEGWRMLFHQGTPAAQPC